MQTYPQSSSFLPGRTARSSLYLLSSALLLFTFLVGLRADAPLEYGAAWLTRATNKKPAGLNDSQWQSVQTQIHVAQYHYPRHEPSASFSALNSQHGGQITFTNEPLLFSEIKTLTPTDEEDDSNFGASTDISGDILVVGNPHHDSYKGAATIFYRNRGGGGNWGAVKKLTAADSSEFGFSVAISGDTVVVGEYNTDNSPGRAHIYHRNEGGSDNWGAVKTLIDPAGAEINRFGYAVDISGNTVIVGAPYHIEGNIGQAYVYYRHRGGNNNWGQVIKLTDPDELDHGWFGRSVAVSDDANTIAVGDSPTRSRLGSGAAYLFTRHTVGQDKWGLTKKLTTSGVILYDQFGHSLDFSGDTLVVGSPNEVEPYDFISGSVYVYYRNEGGAGSWGEVKKLTAADDVTHHNYFGSAVAVSGDTLLIGNHRYDSDKGAVFVFKRNEGGANNWGEVDILAAYDSSDPNGFGTSVAVDEDTLAVGAIGTYYGRNDEAVYVYQTVRPGSLTITKSAVPSDGTDFIFDLSTEWGREGTAGGQFLNPEGAAIDGQGNLLVVDSNNDRIQKFDKNGSFLGQFGSSGNNVGHFTRPVGIALDAAGNIVVADTGNNRIQQFDQDGQFLKQWGGLGPGDGYFRSPRDLAIDAQGFIYVSDTGNHLIQKFDRTGFPLAQWGGEGDGNGELRTPGGIVVDAAGDLLVVDTGNHRIQKFDKNGKYLGQWGSEGSGDGQLLFPSDLALNALGEIYVADTSNHRIQRFDNNGNYLGQWGSSGEAIGQFQSPRGLAVNPDGDLFVVDSENHRIQKFMVPAFTLDDAQPDDGDAYGSSVTLNDLLAGQYQVTERALEGWQLDSLLCSGAQYSQVNVDEVNRQVTIDLAAEEHVSCTFTNRLPTPTGTLTFVKSASPSDGTDFTFDLSGPANASTFVLDDAQPDDGDDVSESVTYEDIPTGQYTAAERALAGWELEDLTCSGAEDSQFKVDKANRKVTIDLAEDEHVTCTFTNKLAPSTNSLTFIKSALPSDGTDFTFDLTDPGSASSFVLDDAQPDDGDNVSQNVTYEDLPTGQYTVIERALDGWDFKDLTCSGANAGQITINIANRMATIDLLDGQQISCTFFNERYTMALPLIIAP